MPLRSHVVPYVILLVNLWSYCLFLFLTSKYWLRRMRTNTLSKTSLYRLTSCNLHIWIHKYWPLCMCVYFQVSEGKVDKATGIFYKALQNIPWAKVWDKDEKVIFHNSSWPVYFVCVFSFLNCTHKILIISLCLCVCVIVYECKCAFLQICVYGACVRSGFVHGWSAVVPGAPAGVCRSYDRERTATQTAFRRTGYTAGGLTYASFKN